MNMQKQVYDAGRKWDQFYNDTVVDYSLQLEAAWQQLRERVSARMGNKAASNVIYADFSQQDRATEMPPLEVGQGS